MIIKIFSINDVKAASFGQPFFAMNKGIAVRMFSDLVNDKNSMVSKHPDDFKLYMLGEFDDNSGGLSPVAQPEFLHSASEFVNV